MRWVLGVLVMLVALAVAILAFAPASAAMGYLRDASHGALAFDGSHGTIWSGSAVGVAIHGEQLGRMQWTLSPWAALRSRIDARLHVDGPQGVGSGRLRREGEAWRINDVQAELPALLLGDLLAHERLVPHGRLVVQLEELSGQGRLPQSAVGRLRWVDARVSGAAHADLGELVADFTTPQEGRLEGVLSDTGGPLQLEGLFHVSWLGYGVEMTLTPRSRAVSDALSHIGHADGGSSRFYAVEGRWLASPGAPGG